MLLISMSLLADPFFLRQVICDLLTSFTIFLSLFSMARKQKLKTVEHPSLPRKNTRAASKLDLGVCGTGGPSQTQLEHASDATPRRKGSLEQAAEISRECQIKMWKTRGTRKASSWAMK